MFLTIDPDDKTPIYRQVADGIKSLIARRELAEETGYRATSFEELAAYFPSPGVLSERMWIFVARELVPGEPAREANEEIENLIVPWDEAIAMIDRGEIRDGKTIIALLTLDRHHTKKL